MTRAPIASRSAGADGRGSAKRGGRAVAAALLLLAASWALFCGCDEVAPVAEGKAPSASLRSKVAPRVGVSKKAPADNAEAKRAVPGPPRKIFLRMLGALPEAKIEAPRLRRALSALRGIGRQKMDPLSRLPAHLAPLCRKVTLRGDPKKRQYEMREALYAPPPFKATWKVRVPEEGRLIFETAARGAVRFAVDVVRGADTARLFSGESRKQGHEPWAWREVDLSAYAGQEVELSLITEGRSGHGFFASPRVMGKANDAPPSVLLITIDTLSARPVGFTGSDRGLSPNMDRFAATGVAFTRAYTNANWTRASTLAMFGSEYTTRLGINAHSWWLNKRKRSKLYVDFDGMLPQLLKQAGYISAAVGNNLFLLGYHSAGVEMGFEHVSDMRTDHRDTPDITAAAQAFLKRHRDRPFFYFVNYNTPHHPYSPPRRYLKGVDRPGERLHPQLRRYLGEVAYVDDHIGRLLKTVTDLGLRERTLIVLNADHGEGLRGDNTYVNVAIPRSSRFTHTVNLYEEVVRIPFAISRPADLPSGKTVTRPISLLDFGPTILSLIGLPPHPQHRGTDLSSVIRGPAQGTAPPVFTEGKKCSSVLYKGYKYIKREPGYDIIARRREGYRQRRIAEELYHTAVERKELRNLMRKRPPILTELRKMHRQWQRSLRGGVLPRAPWRPGERAVASAQPPGKLSPAPRTHLLVGGDGKRHRIQGSIHVQGRVRAFRMLDTETDDAIWLPQPDRLDFSFTTKKFTDQLYLETDPPQAEMRVALKVDGRPYERVLAGPFGLPLLRGSLRLRVKDYNSILHAQVAPHRRRGDPFGVYLWRTGASDSQPAPSAPLESGDSDGLDPEVQRALRGWGYIQRGDKKVPK